MTGAVDQANLSTAALALITACCPGSPQLLRTALSKPWAAAQFVGERITLEFDVPDDGAHGAAADLVNRSNDCEPIKLAVPGCTVADLTAWLGRADACAAQPGQPAALVLKVDVLVLNNAAPVKPWGGVR